MSVPFNCDGPVKVSQTDFDTYKSLFKDTEPSFDALFFYWFDEAHSDDVRRLALRDLFRQSSKHPIHAHYRTDMSLGRFINLLRWNDPKESSVKRKTVTYRPKLLSELIDEFLYAAQNHRIHDNQGNINELIEYLIPLVDEATGRQLFSCHQRWTCYPFPDRYVESYTRGLLEDIINETYPEWVRNELWGNYLKKHCINEIESLKRANLPTAPITISHIHHCHENVKVPALYTLGDFIGRCVIYKNERDFTLLTKIIKFLEEKLPAHIAYVYSDHEMIQIAPHLTDENVMSDYIHRHVLMLTEKSLDFETHDWLLFLYWARGLTTHSHPDDVKLLAEIDRCIAEIHSLS